MKLLITFICCIGVIGFGGLFILKKPDGTPWLSLNDLIPSVDSVTATINDAVPDQVIGGSDGNVAVYRWQDAEGNWQFSDVPPENIAAEQVLVNTDLNRDLVPKFNARPRPQSSPDKGKALLIKDSSLPTPTTVSPDKISKLIEDAQNVQEIMDNRQQQLDKAINSSN